MIRFNARRRYSLQSSKRAATRVRGCELHADRSRGPWLRSLGGGDEAVEGRVEVVIDDLLVGVRVEPVHDVAHTGGIWGGTDEFWYQCLDLAVVEDHRV